MPYAPFLFRIKGNHKCQGKRRRLRFSRTPSVFFEQASHCPSPGKRGAASPTASSVPHAPRAKFIGVSSTRLVHGPHVGAAASSLRPESRAALTSPRHVWLEPAPPMLSHGPPGRGPFPQSQRGQCLLCFLPKPRLPVGAEFLPSSLLGPFG